MKQLAIAVMCAAIAACAANSALADSATAYVGTVNGTNAFTLQESGAKLYFHPQPDTDYVWMENNGSAPGTVATYTYNSGGVPVTADRDGMKTFACTDVAYGATLNTIQLSFDYNTGTDPTTGLAMSSPSMNIFLTDGSGHYGIWAATSGSAKYSDTVLTGADAGWTRRTLNCTTIVDDGNNGVAIYEHNDLVVDHSSPYANVGWDDIKNFTIAGFYDYQRTPQGGFEDWGQTLWNEVTNVGNPGDTTLNEYGITINWGDTVGGMLGDGSGEIGSNAERAYGQAGRLIRNFAVTVGSTTYEMTFAPGVVPEPGTLVLAITAGLGALAFALRRRRS